MWNPLRRKKPLVIRVYPISERDGKVCQAKPWGSEGYRRCPFLRDGICRMYGFHIRQRPDKIAECTVTSVTYDETREGRPRT